jgi:protein-disulfide isomerase
MFVLIVAMATYVQWRMAKPTSTPSVYEPAILSPELKTLEEVGEYTNGRPIPPVSTEATAGNVGRAVPYEHIRGNPDARISIVEYASATDDYARLIHPALAALVEQDTRINWIYRHFPKEDVVIDIPIGRMSECVHRGWGDEMFWVFMDEIYALPPSTEEDVIALAKELSDDHDFLMNCYDPELTLKDVNDDLRLAETAGKVRLNPTFFFVDNVTKQERVVEGIDTIDFFVRVAETMLAVEE